MLDWQLNVCSNSSVMLTRYCGANELHYMCRLLTSRVSSIAVHVYVL